MTRMEVETSGDEEPQTELIREELRARYRELIDTSPSPLFGSVATTTLTSDEESLPSSPTKQEEQSVTDSQSDVVILQEIAHQSADPCEVPPRPVTQIDKNNDDGQHS